MVFLLSHSCRGWKVIPMLEVLTRTRLTWAHLPPAPQVLGVTPGVPYTYGVSCTPHREMCDTTPTLGYC